MFNLPKRRKPEMTNMIYTLTAVAPNDPWVQSGLVLAGLVIGLSNWAGRRKKGRRRKPGR